MSQLLDKLDRAGDRFVQPLGFGGSSKREDVSPILVLGAIDANQTDETKKANIAKLDGVVIKATDKTTKAALDKSAKLLSPLMFGVWSATPQSKEIKGIDFEIFDDSSTTVGSLTADERTFLMTVDLGIDEGLTRAIDLLPVNAFIIQILGGNELTIDHLLQIGRISTATSKPVFLHLSSIPLDDELRGLRDVGIAALIIDLQDNSIEEFAKLHTSLLALPQKTLDRDQRKVNSSLSNRISTDPDDEYEED